MGDKGGAVYVFLNPVFEGGTLVDKGGAVNVLSLFFSVFCFYVFVCFFSVFCVFSMFSVFFSMFFLCFSVFLLPRKA